MLMKYEGSEKSLKWSKLLQYYCVPFQELNTSRRDDKTTKKIIKHLRQMTFVQTTFKLLFMNIS